MISVREPSGRPPVASSIAGMPVVSARAGVWVAAGKRSASRCRSAASFAGAADMEGAEAGVHAGSVRERVGAGGMFAEWFPEAENRVAAEDLHDAAAMEVEQGGAAVGAGEEGAEEMHGRKGLKGARAFRFGGHSGGRGQARPGWARERGGEIRRRRCGGGRP